MGTVLCRARNASPKPRLAYLRPPTTPIGGTTVERSADLGGTDTRWHDLDEHELLWGGDANRERLVGNTDDTLLWRSTVTVGGAIESCARASPTVIGQLLSCTAGRERRFRSRRTAAYPSAVGVNVCRNRHEPVVTDHERLPY